MSLLGKCYKFILYVTSPCRTGLPPELSGLSGEDDSDEEYSDEDDEDSNGM